MKKILLSIAVIAALVPSVRAYSLTYAGMLVQHESDDKRVIVVNTSVTNISSIVVSLHTGTNSVETALWSRHYTNVPVSDGAFSVVIEGASESGTTYKTLDEVLAARADSKDICVGLSEIKGDGLDKVRPELSHGRLTAAPYAIIADCGLQAKKSFRVSGGYAYARKLTVQGDVQINNIAAFRDDAKFNSQVTMDSLEVKGKFARKELTNVSTFEASSLSAANGLTASVAVNTKMAELSTKAAKFKSLPVVNAETLLTKAVQTPVFAASTMKVTGKASVSSLSWQDELTVDGSPIDDEKVESTATRTAQPKLYTLLKEEYAAGKASVFMDPYLGIGFNVSGSAVGTIFPWFSKYETVAIPVTIMSVIEYGLKNRDRTSLCAVPVTPSGGAVAFCTVSSESSWTHVCGNANNHMTITVLVPLAAGAEDLIAVSDTTFTLHAPRWREMSK